ncbi:hypothetical protein Aros01_03290 [Streptosporangium roseum]
MPNDVTVHLDAGYDSDKTRTLLNERGLHGRLARKGEKAPIQASRRWHVERTHAWQNAFYRIACCYGRRAVVDAFFGLADTIITVCSLIRQARTPESPTMTAPLSVRPPTVPGRSPESPAARTSSVAQAR